MFGRGGLAFLDGSTRTGQRLTFRQLRQRLVHGFFVLLHILQLCAIGSIQRPPAVIFHCAALGGKLRSGALDNNGGFRKGIGLGHGAQQPQSHQLQHRLFAHRQAGQIRTLEVAGRDHRMMVGYFLVVDDRTGIAGNGVPFPKRHGLGNQIDQHRQAFSHIARQIAAVCSGIGAELLFVQILEVV